MSRWEQIVFGRWRFGLTPLAQLRIGLDLALQRHRGADVGFLPRDAPVFQFVERNGLAGDRAAHEGAGAGDLEVPVEIADAGFPSARALKAVHHMSLSTDFF